MSEAQLIISDTTKKYLKKNLETRRANAQKTEFECKT